MPGRLRGVRGGFDPWDDPDQAALPVSVRHDAFQPVDVVEVVDDHQSEAVLDRQLELLVGLGIAVQDEPVRIGARLDGGEDLAAARHIEMQALFDHHPLNRGAWERLRRERQIAAGPAAAERVEIASRPVSERVLVDDDGRSTELVGDVVEPAPAHHEGAVSIGLDARREQVQADLLRSARQSSPQRATPADLRGATRR